MEFYIGITILSLILSFFVKKIKWLDKHPTIAMFIAILPLTIASALRFKVGWDYESYSMRYDEYNIYGSLNFNEIGFNTIIRTLSLFTTNYVFLFILFSILTSFFFSRCYSVYGKKEHLYQYILLFVLGRYFFCSLNIIRQALSMTIVLYAMHFLIKKKRKMRDYIKSIIYILIASSIHQFSLMFLPLIFILPLNLDTKKEGLRFIILSGLVILATIVLVNLTGYTKYFETMFGNDGETVVSELFISMAILLFCFLSHKKIEGYNRLFLNMEIIVFIISLLSAYLPTSDRIVWYFSLQNIFFIPNVIDMHDKSIMKIISSAVIYIFLSVVVYNQCVKIDSFNVIPYQSVYDAGGPFERSNLKLIEHL